MESNNNSSTNESSLPSEINALSGFEDNDDADPNNAKPANPDEITESVKQKAISDFKVELEIMSKSDISLFEVNYYGGTQERAYSTTDKALIKKWISFFEKFELSAEPYMPRDGATYCFSYSIGNDKKIFCNSAFPILDYDFKYTEFEVVNFSELEEEFDSLKVEIGINF